MTDKKKTNKKIKAILIFLLKPISFINKRIRGLLSRRPHRSFLVTKRRDYIKESKLPGVLSFTKHVFKTLWMYRKKFSVVILVYAVLSFLLVGIASQDLLNNLNETLNSTENGLLSGNLGSFEKAGMLFLTSVSGGLSEDLTDVQQLYAGIILIMSWLSCVWLLRNLIAGHKIKVRDAVYNSGAPILPTLLVSLLLIVQALPIALALIGYGAAASTGLLDGGVEAMMFWVAAILLAVLSLYWMTSTLISLVVVTLPGMYPYQAIKIGSDLVVGRRVKILIRLVWMVLLAIVIWALILIPSLLLDGWLKNIWSWYEMIPTVPILILLLSSFSVVWVSSYVYLLYRKVVADDAATV